MEVNMNKIFGIGICLLLLGACIPFINAKEVYEMNEQETMWYLVTAYNDLNAQYNSLYFIAFGITAPEVEHTPFYEMTQNELGWWLVTQINDLKTKNIWLQNYIAHPRMTYTIGSGGGSSSSSPIETPIENLTYSRYDLNKDGIVGVDDYMIMEGQWAKNCSEIDCTADFNGDGIVGVDDYMILELNWGK
jgi:hypothetical protein